MGDLSKMALYEFQLSIGILTAFSSVVQPLMISASTVTTESKTAMETRIRIAAL